MIDLFIMLFWFAAVSAGGVIYWMRQQMENLGYDYPSFNSSFKMMTDFYSRIGFDKKLRKRYYRTIVIVIFIWLLICLTLWFISN